MNAKLKSRWWVDAALFATFLTTFFLNLTGLALHQWLGIASGAIAAYHLISHWDWVKKVAGRVSSQAASRVQSYALIDILLFDGLFTIIGTGVVISSWLNLDLAAYSNWHFVHVCASLITLLLVVLKIGLHWRWIVSVARNVFTRPARQPGMASPGATALPQRLTSRREFGRLMAVVGAGSIFALARGVKGLAASGQETTTASSASSFEQSDGFLASILGGSGQTASVSTARCPKGCAFPGRCRRYTDSNNNSRCDLGETA